MDFLQDTIVRITVLNMNTVVFRSGNGESGSRAGVGDRQAARFLAQIGVMYHLNQIVLRVLEVYSGRLYQRPCKSMQLELDAPTYG
jgi:hypothetical protein